MEQPNNPESNQETPVKPKPSEVINQQVAAPQEPVIQSVKEPIVEKITTQPKEQKEEVKESSIILQICNGSRGELEDEVVANADKFKDIESLTEENSYILKLASTSEAALYTRAAEFINETLDKREASFSEAESKMSHGGKFSTNLTGSQATMAFTAKLQGYKKIYLANSGFYIVIKPWSMGELSAFFQSIDIEDKELGRLMGYWRFTIHDAFIKSKFMDIFPSCVINSNLKSWANSDTLCRNISMHDYDTLVWAVCSLMYKEPVDLNVTCLECQEDTKTKCDISKMNLINNNILNKEAIQFLYDDSVKEVSEIKRYKEELICAHDTIKVPVVLEYSDAETSMEYEMVVPSIKEYLVNAKKCIADIIAAANGENDIQNKKLLNQSIINFSRGYIPWLTKLSLFENDKVTISTSDKKAFPTILENLGYDDTNSETYEEFYKFMRDSNASAIGFIPPKCGACGKSHETESGFVAWDAEKLFFDLIYLKLISQGLDMT